MLSRLIGASLRGYCAGEHALAWYAEGIASAPVDMHLESPSFECGQRIPARFAGKGVGLNISPALSWSNVPAEARELVLLVEDASAPLPKPFVHVLVTGIPPEIYGLHEGELSSTLRAPMVLGRNSFGRVAYAGPRALPGHGEHRYSYQLFALNSSLLLDGAARRRGLLNTIQNTVISRARLDGLFERD